MPLRYYLYVIFIIIPLLFFSVLLLFWVWPPILIFAPVLMMILFFIRIRRQRMVLVLVQAALETGTPLHEVLDSYAGTCWGPWYREKVLRFAENIRDGHSLAAAAVACRGVLRYDAVGLIRLGGDTGQLGSLLTQTIDETRKSGHIQLQSIFRLSWFCGYVPFLVFIPLFFMIWIVPKFEQIFMDFDTPLPLLTRYAIQLTHFMLRHGFLFFPIVVLLAFVPFLYFIVRSGVFPWRPPGVRHLLRETDAAHFLRILAAGLEMNKPIPEIMETYVYVVPSFYLKNLAHRFSRQVESGADWIAVLRSVRWFSKGEAALAAAAVRVENVPEMLRELAVSKQERQIASDNAMGRLFFLGFVLAIGAVVGLFAVAFFLPLVELINTLTF